MSLRSLSDLWPTLGVDERLAILLEQQTVELRQIVARLEEVPHATSRARIAGYASALADVRFYVVEGNPLPEAGDL